MEHEKVLIETPLEKNPLRVKKPAKSAAGLDAVWKAFWQIMRTGAFWRGGRAFLKLNQKKGFDCPGCAWPEPDGHRHVAEFCENGAKAVAEETTSKRATPEVFGLWTIAQLSHLTDYNLGLLGRFTEPMILRESSDRYQKISWSEAFDLVGEALNGHAPDEAVFYTSGKATNEPAYLFQLFSRLYGTNNLPDCSNMCHESSGVALSRTIGIGKGSVKLDDFDHADCILIMGQNPGTNHPRMLSALQTAVQNKCKIISINPLQEPGLAGFKNPQQLKGLFGIATHLACLHLPVRINGDVAVLKGIIKLMLEEERRAPGTVINRRFIEQYTEGFAEVEKNIDNTTWAEILESSSVSQDLIEQAAKIIMKSERMITCWAMGLTQHKNGVANIEEIVNLHLLRGQIGRKGAGLCPVRGHSNVQGDRTMGVWEQLSDTFRAALKREFNFEPPTRKGYDVVGAIEAMHAGKVKTFISLGGNFQAATPDTSYVSEAMKKVKLFVHVSTKPHRGHLVTGQCSLILPCFGRTEVDLQKNGEQFVTTENSMGVVQHSKGNLPPRTPHLKSETAIVAGMAHATFRNDREKNKKVNWLALTDNYDLIRDHVERTIPGFKNFNGRMKTDGHFYLPHPVRDELRFETTSRKALFTVNQIPPPLLTKPDEFLLMTIRTHDQFNTTIYGEDDRYRGVFGGRRVVFMHPDDIEAQGFTAGKRVDIESHFQGQKRKVHKFTIVPYEIPRRCVACYYPEANPLGQIGNFADGSRQPVYKSLVVTMAASS